MANVRLTKRVEFSASHRYANEAWDEARNRAAFGPCYRAPGHGHNYLLEVTVAGEVDEQTGMVVNLVDLKHVLKDVLAEFDHKHLNLDTPYFTQRIPTTENIAAVLWSRLSGRMPAGSLERLRLFEDEDLFAETTAEQIRAGEATVTRRYHVSAAHLLRSSHLSDPDNQRLYGSCSAGLHGHNFVLSVAVRGPIDPDTGMVTDLVTLDRFVHASVLPRLASLSLTDDPELGQPVPTGEAVSRWVWGLLEGRPAGGRLERIGLVETHDRSYEYARPAGG
ncbi:6-carboxytetrahydropterin synthase [Candidatus Nitrospira bockiana]